MNKSMEQEKVQDVIKINVPKDKVPVKYTEMEALKDHNETNFDEASDSPTSSRETIKVFLAIAANKGWKIRKLRCSQCIFAIRLYRQGCLC